MTSIKTKRDSNGNYKGCYNGFEFIVFNHNEGWSFDIHFYNDVMMQKDVFSSLQFANGYYKTKKITLKILESCIDNNDFK